MGGLLEAMIEKLRSGQEEKVMDIEARPREAQTDLRRETSDYNTAKNIDTIEIYQSISAKDKYVPPDESKFWPFKATKTDDEIQKEEGERRQLLRKYAQPLYTP